MSVTKHKPKPSQDLRAVRKFIALKGWTQRAISERLEISETHLSLVLNGHRISASLIRRIKALPENPNAKW